MSVLSLLTIVAVVAAAGAGAAYQSPLLSAGLIGVAVAAVVAEEIVRRRRSRPSA